MEVEFIEPNDIIANRYVKEVIDLSLHPLPLGWRVSPPVLNLAQDSHPIAFDMVTIGNLG